MLRNKQYLECAGGVARHERFPADGNVIWQAFVYPVSGELWKVSYELVATTSLDSTSELAGVFDTEKYYQSITADGTTSGIEPLLPLKHVTSAAATQQHDGGMTVYEGTSSSVYAG